MIDHNYPVYILIWLLLSLLTLWLFRTISRKMKHTEDRQTQNSWFTIMILLGLPMLLASILSPLIFIIGDKAMETHYKFIWGGLILIFMVYFFIKQRTPAQEPSQNNFNNNI